MQETSTPIGKFIDPEAIIKQLNISSGSMAADFGCGPGYFSLPFANVIGEDGHLYALDVLPQALESVKSKAKTSGLVNISTQRVNLEKEGGSHLRSASLDWVIMKDVLFQNQKKEIMLAEAYRVLKNGGKMVVVEWNDDDSNIGPERSIRISQDHLKKIVGEAGFKIEKNVDAGYYHYAFVALKE
jgi:ubiquinone/menaquinone biosynthesis C-methylase UbiE